MRVLLAAAALGLCCPAQPQESSSRRFRNTSLTGSQAAPAARVRTAPAPARQAPAPPRAPAAPPRQPWGWILLAGGAAFAAAAALRLRERRQERRAGRTLALAAHELKSPLSAIESYLDLMVMEAPEDARDMRRWLEDLRRMKSTAAHLRRTIGDMLEMTRLEDGRVNIQTRPTALRPLLERAAAAYSAAAKERGVSIVLEGPAELDARADPERLRQIVDNLLGNALKYSPRGQSVRVALRADGTRTLIELRDRGPGIPPELRGRLFQKFSRLSSAPDGSDGTGLGLYISRLLAEAQGGRLDFEPGEGGGSVFRVTLPSARP